jgi:long-chain fatty acid transport protein
LLFNASVLYTLHQTDVGKPRLKLAFVRRQAVLPVDGVFLVIGALVANSSSSIRLPEIYTWDVAFLPIRNAAREWKVEVDVDYARWESIRNFDVRLFNGVILGNPQQWSNAINIGVGTEYRWLSFPGYPAWSVALRTGCLHSQQAIPDVNFNPAAPDGPSHTLSVGGGFLLHRDRTISRLFDLWIRGGILRQEGFGIDVAYQALLFESRTVTGNPNPTVNGTYQTTTHAGSVTMRVNF